MNSLTSSSSKHIQRTYMYLFQDEIERVDTMDEVCRDYRKGKFDPLSSAFKPQSVKNKVV